MYVNVLAVTHLHTQHKHTFMSTNIALCGASNRCEYFAHFLACCCSARQQEVNTQARTSRVLELSCSWSSFWPMSARFQPDRDRLTEDWSATKARKFRYNPWLWWGTFLGSFIVIVSFKLFETSYVDLSTFCFSPKFLMTAKSLKILFGR